MPSRREPDTAPPARLRAMLDLDDPSNEEAYARLIKMLAEPREQDIAWWYAVGRCVEKLHPVDHTRGHRNGVVASLIRALPLGFTSNPAGLLYRARAFAVCLSKAEIGAIARAARTRPEVTPRKAAYLLPVRSTRQRKALLRRYLAERWTGDRLRREVQVLIGNRRALGGRYPRPRPALGVAMTVREIVVLARRWLADSPGWCSSGGLEARKPPVRASLPVVERDVEEALRLLPDVSKEVDRLKRQLHAAAKRLRKLGRRRGRSSARG